MARKIYLESEKGYKINQLINIDGDEFLHAIKVLRNGVGDKISLIDGFGYEYESVIESVDKKSFTLKVLDKQLSKNETKSNVTVFQALVKGDKFELITQKLTELGISEIVPFESEFCQVKKHTTRLDRLEKISIEALKQCGRAKKVEIKPILTFDQMLESLKKYDVVVFAYEKATENICSSMFNGSKIAIIVGSEGGFSEKEVEKLSNLENIKIVSLGNRILRAETASIVLAGLSMFCLGEFNLNEWKNNNQCAYSWL